MWGRQMGKQRSIARAVEIYLDGPEREEDLVVHEHSGKRDTHGGTREAEVYIVQAAPSSSRSPKRCAHGKSWLRRNARALGGSRRGAHGKARKPEAIRARAVVGARKP